MCNAPFDISYVVNVFLNTYLLSSQLHYYVFLFGVRWVYDALKAIYGKGLQPSASLNKATVAFFSQSSGEKLYPEPFITTHQQRMK